MWKSMGGGNSKCKGPETESRRSMIEDQPGGLCGWCRMRVRESIDQKVKGSGKGAGGEGWIMEDLVGLLEIEILF